MSQHIRDRINRKLDGFDEQRLYQALDFVEFLEVKYPAAQPAAPANPLQRFADGVEDRLRAGGIAASTVSEAMGFLNRAVGVLNNVAKTGQTVVTDIASAAQKMGTAATGPAVAPPSGTAPATGAASAPTPGTPPGPAPTTP